MNYVRANKPNLHQLKTIIDEKAHLLSLKILTAVQKILEVLEKYHGNFFQMRTGKLLHTQAITISHLRQLWITIITPKHSYSWFQYGFQMSKIVGLYILMVWKFTDDHCVWCNEFNAVTRYCTHNIDPLTKKFTQNTKSKQLGRNFWTQNNNALSRVLLWNISQHSWAHSSLLRTFSYGFFTIISFCCLTTSLTTIRVITK